jgi:hypothetical protein
LKTKTTSLHFQPERAIDKDLFRFACFEEVSLVSRIEILTERAACEYLRKPLAPGSLGLQFPELSDS